MTVFTPVCPVCRHAHRQIKAGMAVNGNQRYQCQDCKRSYVRENRRFRYSTEVRAKAIELQGAGLTYREIARQLAVNHQTIANWIKQHANTEALYYTQPGEHVSEL